ncbi:hypothetical protein FHP25_34940 [Vineibacter terrae]|uniref:Uncharacterized protein n=1 Tax=Vineibacter terrae TaxID=2586908 RepID=A0A5C8P963_9HYPH|nr:hypothetical protein [Vineibacter terrae]TXL70326.1 hypothetical protein FHP25_34940 [Vineibacter terrae]
MPGWLIAAGLLLAAIGLLAMRREKAKAIPDGAGDPQEKRYLEERRRVGEALRDRLDRQPFGAELANALWQALMRMPPGDGVIVEYHRDYCGHGLIRTKDGVMLCEIQDGAAFDSQPIASWRQQEPFVGFFARQSDFTCSGWDPSEPVFATDDDWNRSNQRLTRRVLEAFLKRHPG